MGNNYSFGGTHIDGFATERELCGDVFYLVPKENLVLHAVYGNTIEELEQNFGELCKSKGIPPVSYLEQGAGIPFCGTVAFKKPFFETVIKYNPVFYGRRNQVLKMYIYYPEF